MTADWRWNLEAGERQEALVPGMPAIGVEVRRILIIGGMGFIGRHLVQRLAGGGRVLRVLTRNPEAARSTLHGEDIEVFGGSYRDPAVLKAVLEGVDAVYHLAKSEGRNWQEHVVNDVVPTRLLAEAATRQGVRRFIYVGSIDPYASARAGDRIDGSTPLDPRIDRRNNYARSKAACEELLQAMAREQGLPLVIVRPGVVIGVGSSAIHYGVGRFTRWNRLTYWGNGANLLPFVLVQDVADALARALEVPGIEGRSFLVCDIPLLSARDYVAAMQAHSGTAIHAAPRSIWQYWLADLARAMVKVLIRYPNRRLSTLHDWQCRAHRATYDATESFVALGWRPAGTREALISLGIHPAVDAEIAGGGRY